MSEYQRRAMGLSVTKVDKPYDAEIEYLRTTGTQHLILDIEPNIATDAMEIYFLLETNVTLCRFFSGGSVCFYINGSNNFAVGLYGGSAWTWLSVYAVNVGTVKRKWKVDYLNKVVTVDDVNVYTITKTLTNIEASSVYIACANDNFNRSLKGKIFHVKYWRNGELIRDMIPVRIGTVGYLYDKINSVLYENKGTGEFGLGRDIYRDIRDYTLPDYVMSERSLLDTRFIANGNTRVVLDEWHRMVPYDGNYYSILGARTGSKKTDFTFIQVLYAAAANYMLPSDTYNTNLIYPGCDSINFYRVIVDKNKGNISILTVYNDFINYSATRTTASFSSRYPMYLGYFNENRTNYNTTSVGFAGSIYNFKVYDNDIQIRDYIPAIHPDGTVGFFDSINETFHESDNTRAFRPGYNHESTNGNKFIFYNTGVNSSLDYVCNDSDLLSSLLPVKTRRIKIKKDPNYTTTVIEYGCRSIIKKGGLTIISSDSTGDTIEVGPDCNHIALLVEGAPFNYDPDVDVIDVGDPNYLCFTALEDGTFTLTIGSTITVALLLYVEYSIDNGQTWVKTDNKASTTITITTPTITTGNKVLWRGIGLRTSNGALDQTSHVSKFSSTGNFDISGNLLSILYGEQFYSKDNLPTSDSDTFRYLFGGCSKLIHAHLLCLPVFLLRTSTYNYLFGECVSLISPPKLHSLKLATHCYTYMFNGCTSLTELPYLPAKYLALYCYNSMFAECTSLVAIGNIMPSIANLVSTYAFTYMFAGCISLLDASGLTINLLNLNYTCNHMFYGCISLTVPPTITATSVASYACQYMFANCTSLVTAPALPATTLGTYCYFHMFDGCTSLVNAPALPATTLLNYCYLWMFKSCTSLITAPALPCTGTITTNAYGGMFAECTSLVNAPALPCVRVNANGYSSMFLGCTSLVDAPDLPAAILGNLAYSTMFQDCTNLINAPKLHSPIISTGGYNDMFKNCPKINYIECLADTIVDTNTSEWLDGVSSTGIFILRAGSEWTSGTSGIPTGWTIIYFNPENGKYYTDSACTTEWNNSPTLPYTSKIEYLQNDNTTARILIGKLNYTNVTKYEVKFYYNNHVNYARIVSNGLGSNYNCIILLLGASEGLVRCWFNTKENGGNTNIENIEKQEVHTAIVLKAVSLTIDDETVEITNATNGTVNANILTLFSNNSAATTTYNAGIRIYYFKAWYNDTLMVNLIPVRVGTEGAMYDLASGELLTNPMTGLFTLGPDIT